MALPAPFLDELRARAPVSDVARRRLKLIRRGREYTALCPFHNEKTPSFTISDDKGFYHCFGCGAHGDVISFVMRSEGLSFPEAVEKLAGEAGLSVPRDSPEERAAARRRADLHEVVEAAASWFEAQLQAPAGRAARAYLERRGVAEATRARFRLGYAPEGRGHLRRALAGIDEARLAEAGLIKGEARGAPRDHFFSRLVFPITDPRGRVIAFGGRVLGEGGPKYLNSPDTPLFRKGRVLYGLAMAREAARRRGALIVAEGYMDVLALAGAGIEHAVAPLGTALTEEQILLMWRLADEPTLCFDGDAAGERAALRAAERALPLVKPGKSLAFVALPPGEDPDSLIAAHGADGFTRQLVGARPLVEVIWAKETKGRRIETPERRADLERRLEAHVRAIAERGVRFQYQSEFRARLRAAFAPRRRPVAGRAPDRAAEVSTYPGLRRRGDTDALLEQQERILLALIVAHPWLLDEAAEALAEVSLASRSLDRMLHGILEAGGLAGGLDSAGLQSHLNGRGFAAPLRRVLDAGLIRQASCISPDAEAETVRDALAEYLAWHRRRQVGVDRLAAERVLADDMTDANSETLLNFGRIQANGGL